MYHRIHDSKYRLEIVSFVWDFSEHFNPGDTILGTPSVVILVSSGDDTNPGDMIFNSPVVTGGTIVSQQIRRGIPGTIYTVTITVSTVQGDVFEDLAYLAILPLDQLAFNTILQTMLYPIEMVYERLTSTISLISGKFGPFIIMVPEAITSSITFISGILFGRPLNYLMTVLAIQSAGGINGNEAITATIKLLTGILFNYGSAYYNMIAEGVTASITLISGTLFGSPVTYDMKEEAIISSITLLSGTLI